MESKFIACGKFGNRAAGIENVRNERTFTESIVCASDQCKTFESRRESAVSQRIGAEA